MKKGIEKSLSLAAAMVIFWPFSIYDSPLCLPGTYQALVQQQPKKRIIDFAGGFQLDIQPYINLWNDHIKKYNEHTMTFSDGKSRDYNLTFKFVDPSSKTFCNLRIPFS